MGPLARLQSGLAKDANGKASRSLAEVVEAIGFGAAQLQACVIGGGVWLADGAELLLIGSVTRAVAEEWRLAAWQRGAVVSVVFVGIFLGNAASGPLGDSWGRRLPIVASYAAVFVFSILSAAAWDFWGLCTIRLFVGLSFGVGQPAWNALSSEITPTYWRIVMQGGSQMLFAVGEMYSAALIYADDPEMQHLNWRMLLVYGAFPSLVLGVLAWALLGQSPSYLALHGQHEEAKQELAALRRANGGSAMSVDFRPPPVVESGSAKDAVARQLGIVWGRRMRYTTGTAVYSCFALNVVFYGCLYAFPQVVSDIEMGSSPAMSLLVGALWEIPGFVCGTLCGMWMKRKPAIMLYAVSIVLSLVAFAYGGTHKDSHWSSFYLTHGGYFGIKFFASFGFIAIYQYTAEVYPTVARTTGAAMCLAGGRAGGFLAPLAFEELLVITGNFGTFFYGIAGLVAVNLVLVVFLPFETAGVHLVDEHDADATAPLACDRP